MKKLLTLSFKSFSMLFLMFETGSTQTNIDWNKFNYFLDLGAPKGVFGFGGIEPNKLFYFRGSGNVFSYPSDDITYDFSPNLYDDQDRGKLTTYVSFGGGKALKTKKNKEIYLIGLQLGFQSQYFKEYDSLEILSDDGNYYVTDDDNKSKLYITPNLGIMIPNTNSKSGGFYSIGFELVPLNIYFGYVFGS